MVKFCWSLISYTQRIWHGEVLLESDYKHLQELPQNQGPNVRTEEAQPGDFLLSRVVAAAAVTVFAAAAAVASAVTHDLPLEETTAVGIVSVGRTVGHSRWLRWYVGR